MNNFGRTLSRARWFFGLAAIAVTANVVAQTNPAPQALPYTQDFSALLHTATAYPVGWQGWTIAAAQVLRRSIQWSYADRYLLQAAVHQPILGTFTIQRQDRFSEHWIA
ncbi:MAG: hypothetical protein IPP33_01840 [Flavobacteriales bacterium]|nr:hypothetical protein [Flavobacteriales bacterium]